MIQILIPPFVFTYRVLKGLYMKQIERWQFVIKSENKKNSNTK